MTPAMNTRERIVEVLAKYNVRLEDAPLDALTMAMERIDGNRVELLSRWRAVAKALNLGTHNGEIADYDDEVASELVRLTHDTINATEFPR
jgi:hypothetical protein